MPTDAERFVPVLPIVSFSNEVLLRYIERDLLGPASGAISYEFSHLLWDLCVDSYAIVAASRQGK